MVTEPLSYANFCEKMVSGGEKRADFGQKVAPLIGPGGNAHKKVHPDLPDADADAAPHGAVSTCCPIICTRLSKESDTAHLPERNAANMVKICHIWAVFGPNLGPFSPNPHESTRQERITAHSTHFWPALGTEGALLGLSRVLL